MRTYHVYARCNLPHGVCPYCGHVSRSVHSRYHRTIADLSILGHPVIITFEARKFFCHNPDCRKKTFAEQPGDEVFRYRRRTRRCEMAVTQHGLKCSSESARKLLSATGVPLSGDTVLRDVHRMSVPERCEVKEIGVDDWAFRKGVTYGSIIVSLETGSVIDLLGDRDVKSFQAWLDEHVQVEVVSRDRSTDYTAAIAATGRNITEVADRFHLNMNMSDCVLKLSVLITINIEAPCALRKFKKLRRSIPDKSCSRKSKSYRPRDSTSPRYPRSWILPGRP